MIHFFITRIAVTKVHPRYGIASPDRIRSIIKLWLEKASLFYTQQTKSAAFKVALLYDLIHEPTVKEFAYPEWAEPTLLSPQQWLAKQAAAGQPVTVSRIDADDSYSVDFFAWLENYGFMQPRALVLHKSYLQYDMAKKLLLGPLNHCSPHFATIYFQNFPAFGPVDTAAEAELLRGVVGNHGGYHSHPHITSTKCLALMRITGWNVYNRFGKVLERRVKDVPHDQLDPRFVGY